MDMSSSSAGMKTMLKLGALHADHLIVWLTNSGHSGVQMVASGDSSEVILVRSRPLRACTRDEPLLVCQVGTAATAELKTANVLVMVLNSIVNF